MNIQEEKLIVAKAMNSYGGNFVNSLAKCIYAADSNNLNKIKDTFSEYWQQYLEMGLKREQDDTRE